MERWWRRTNREELLGSIRYMLDYGLHLQHGIKGGRDTRIMYIQCTTTSIPLKFHLPRA